MHRAQKQEHDRTESHRDENDRKENDRQKNRRKENEGRCEGPACDSNGSAILPEGRAWAGAAEENGPPYNTAGDREDVSSMVTAGATRASRESGLLCSHSHGASIVGQRHGPPYGTEGRDSPPYGTEGRDRAPYGTEGPPDGISHRAPVNPATRAIATAALSVPPTVTPTIAAAGIPAAIAAAIAAATHTPYPSTGLTPAHAPPVVHALAAAKAAAAAVPYAVDDAAQHRARDAVAPVSDIYIHLHIYIYINR